LPEVPAISIIDDDASVRAATENLVRSLGYVVTSFASAGDFLMSGDVNHVSCIVADVHMPGMTGIDLQASLLSQGGSVPFVFVTAFPDETCRARALDAGAICFLTKPVDGEVLARCIEAALRRPRA
jgi:FixJ family two-component response regulator